MTIYNNSYELLTQVRMGINEYSTALVNGTDTTGTFLNTELMRKINDAQTYIWNLLFTSQQSLFLTSKSLTAVDSVLTMPSNFFKVKSLEDSEGVPLQPIDSINRSVGFSGVGYYQYYQKGSTLVIDVEYINDSFTLWYYTRCRDLDCGMTSAGGVGTATLATTAKKITSYYNGMMIENVTDDATDTITAYTSARVATVSGTWAASKYYGIVSELPEIFHPLIAERAILLLKLNPKSPAKIDKGDIQLFTENLTSMIRAYAGTQGTDSVLYSFNDGSFND